MMDREVQERVRERKYAPTMEPLVRCLSPALGPFDKWYAKAPQCRFKLRKGMMLVLGMFLYKFPSMFQYWHEMERGGGSPTVASAARPRAWSNLATLLGVQERPEDVTIRRRIDEVRTPD